MVVRSGVGPRMGSLDRGLVFVSDEGAPAAELEFRQLEYFVAVAEELHFSRAAARMYISQPALSQAIAGVERALDVKLFARTRQNVELTEAGAELLRHARAMLADRDDAVASVRRVDRGEAGVLRVGIALLAEPEVAPAFAALSAECPELLLDRSTATSERLLASLRNRELHAAIVHQVLVLTSLEDVEWELIRTGRLAALVSRESGLAERESATLADLSDETFLVPPRELAPSAFEGLQTMCQTYGGFDAQVREFSTLGADWRPVIDGEAIALAAEATARAAEPEGAVAVPIEPPPQYLMAMAWRGGNGSPLLHRFLDVLRAYRDEHDWIEESVPVEGA